MLHEPEHISVTPSAKPADKIEQQLYFVEKQEKRELLPDIIRQAMYTRLLVFTSALKHGADRVARDLNRAGIKTKVPSTATSRRISASVRLRTFKECKIAVLVATDIAARNRHQRPAARYQTLTCRTFRKPILHRIGRTGRYRSGGHRDFFCDRS